MSEEAPAVNTETQATPKAANVLNPVTKKIVERCIQEVLREYVQETKHFTADSMHYLRMKVTDLVKQRLGEEEVVSVDIGLDLTTVENIPFFFKLNIPQEKAEAHVVQQAETPSNPPQ